MKDHEIAGLVNALRDELFSRFPVLPQCLREIIRNVVINFLEKEGLKKDDSK